MADASVRTAAGAEIVAAALVTLTAVAPACSHAAAANDIVTYEVYSDTVPIANLEFMSAEGKTHLAGVALPWRLTTAVPQGTDRSEIRADWRPNAWPSRWVTVRIVHNGEVICQSTLDVGNASCYGNTPHIA